MALFAVRVMMLLLARLLARRFLCVTKQQSPAL
jgi:hypothetical protein